MKETLLWKKLSSMKKSNHPWFFNRIKMFFTCRSLTLCRRSIYFGLLRKRHISRRSTTGLQKKRTTDYFSRVYRKKPYNDLLDLPTLYRRKSLLKTTFWASIEVWLLVFFWRPLSGPQPGPYWSRLLIFNWSFWFSIGDHHLVFHWRPPPGLLWKKKTIWYFVEEDQVFYERRAVSIEDYLLVF